MLYYLNWGLLLFLLMSMMFVLMLSLVMGEEVYIISYNMFSDTMISDFILLFDNISSPFLVVVLLISFSVMIYSYGYMMDDHYPNRFISLVMLFVFSMLLMVMSPNLISILLGWDGLGLVSYCLVIYYQSWISYEGGMLTVLSNRIGDVGILVGICYMASVGSWNFIYMEEMKVSLMVMLGFCILMAGITKSAQIPFSSWLPAAMAAPTPVSSLVHSSTLVTAGVYLFIRYHDILMNMGDMMYYLKYLSLLTMFMAGLGASYENDMKKIIALSTLSQLGIMMYTLSLGYWYFAYFHMLMHALFKALLFLCAGSIIHGVGGYQDLRYMGGLGNFSKIVSFGIMVSNMCLMGLPFMCGFYSKDLILELFSMGLNGSVELSLFVLSIYLTIYYSIRFMKNVLMETYMSFPMLNYSESTYMNFSILFMSIMSIIGGSLMQWLMFNYYKMICLSMFMKMWPMFMVVMGLIVSKMLKLHLNSIMNNCLFFMNMNMMMWNLPMSTMWISGNLLSKMSILGKFELGWMEMGGGESVKFLLLKMSSLISFMQLYYKQLFFMFLLLLMMLMIY